MTQDDPIWVPVGWRGAVKEGGCCVSKTTSKRLDGGDRASVCSAFYRAVEGRRGLSICHFACESREEKKGPRRVSDYKLLPEVNFKSTAPLDEVVPEGAPGKGHANGKLLRKKVFYIWESIVLETDFGGVIKRKREWGILIGWCVKCKPNAVRWFPRVYLYACLRLMSTELLASPFGKCSCDEKRQNAAAWSVKAAQLRSLPYSVADSLWIVLNWQFGSFEDQFIINARQTGNVQDWRMRQK